MEGLARFAGTDDPREALLIRHLARGCEKRTNPVVPLQPAVLTSRRFSKNCWWRRTQSVNASSGSCAPVPLPRGDDRRLPDPQWMPVPLPGEWRCLPL
jgi:hypothetical protein